MSKAAIRPIPFTDETAASILIRTTELNGHANVNNLIGTQERKLTVATIVKEKKLYSEITKDLGLDLDIESIVPYRTGPTKRSSRKFKSKQIPYEEFRDDASAYCPECLIENAYWKKDWLLRAYDVCTKHKILLLEKCPGCDSKLSLTRSSICHCSKCGADFRQAIPKSASTEPVEVFTHLVNYGDQQSLTKYLSFRKSLGEFYSENKIEFSNSAASISASFISSKEKALEQLLESINNSAIECDPIIALLPFLTNKTKEIREFAQELSRHHDLASNAEINDNIKPKLSRKETCAILGITIEKLNSLVKNGKLSNHTVFKNKRNHTYYLTDQVINLIRHTEKQKQSYTKVAESSDWLGVYEISKKLKSNQSTIRSLINKNWIKAEKIKLNGVRMLAARTTEIDEFNAQYVLIGTLAKELNVAPNNLGEKISFLGIFPVGGPKIDGSLVSIYRRIDTIDIKKHHIDSIEKYQTITGRPPKGVIRDKEPPPKLIPITHAATALKISIQKTILLINNGFLEKSTALSRQVFITRESLDTLTKKLSDSDLIPLSKAALAIGISINSLTLNFIKTGIVDCRDYVFWKYITKSELDTLVSIKKKYITASEAGKALGSHRSLLKNFEKSGLITSSLHKKTRSIRLYKRSDLEKIIQKMNDESQINT